MTAPHRLLAITIASLAAIVALAAPAWAHADATAKTDTSASASADGRTVIAIAIEHGCSGNATTGVRIAMPAGATAVRAVDPSGWTSTVTATEIAWTGGSIPATAAGTFEFSLVLSQATGSTITLPTIQTCTNNTEIAWIQTPTGDTSEASRPAPTFVVPAGATTTSAAGASASTSTTARMATLSNAVTDEGSATNSAGRYVFLGVCAAILIGAGALFLKYRKRADGT